MLLVIDRGHDDELLTWMTHGGAGRPDVTLSHDSWNEDETVFPPESHISFPQLREVVVEWAFGEPAPPGGVRWSVVPDITWF